MFHSIFVGILSLLLVAAGSLAAVAAPRTVLVAGDIAYDSAESMDAATAAIVNGRRGLVITTGDHAYRSGTIEEFLTFYAPTWGKFRGRTRPTPGNHEYRTPGAAGYFGYFGRRAGPPGRGYYALKVGSWRVFALDSEACKTPTGCGPGSAQFKWLKRNFRRSPQHCTLAVWHTPRFSSGKNGNDVRTKPLLRLLYKSGADVVLNGHDHDYERMDPARHDGTIDRRHGIRQFVVGTGGAPLRPMGDAKVPQSRAFQARTWGVLQLRLRRRSYSWRFLPIEGQSFEDRGKGRCHGRPH